MSARQSYTTSRLIMRSLWPSPISLFLCLLVGFTMVALNVVLKSVDVGVALPGVFDGQWAIAYSERVVQPLTELLSSNTLNKLLIAGMWGLAGFVVYVGFEYAAHSMGQYKESRDNIRLVRGGQVVKSPGVKDFWQGVLWRVGVIIAAIVVFAAAMVPLLAQALNIAQSVILSQNLLRDGLRLVLAIIIWSVFFHFVVVVLRLYTMRTRLFGDDALY